MVTSSLQLLLLLLLLLLAFSTIQHIHYTR